MLCSQLYRYVSLLVIIYVSEGTSKRRRRTGGRHSPTYHEDTSTIQDSQVEVNLLVRSITVTNLLQWISCKIILGHEGTATHHGQNR